MYLQDSNKRAGVGALPAHCRPQDSAAWAEVRGSRGAHLPGMQPRSSTFHHMQCWSSSRPYVSVWEGGQRGAGEREGYERWRQSEVRRWLQGCTACMSYGVAVSRALSYDGIMLHPPAQCCTRSCGGPARWASRPRSPAAPRRAAIQRPGQQQHAVQDQPGPCQTQTHCCWALVCTHLMQLP